MAIDRLRPHRGQPRRRRGDARRDAPSNATAEAEILNRAFTGFTALPSSAESWWGILGVEPNARRIEIDSAYRRRRSEPTQTGPAATPRYSTRCRRPTSRQSGAPMTNPNEREARELLARIRDLLRADPGCLGDGDACHFHTRSATK